MYIFFILSLSFLNLCLYIYIIYIERESESTSQFVAQSRYVELIKLNTKFLHHFANDRVDS